MTENQQQQEQLDETKYSKIACIQCRRGHRKCDKLLTGCSYCLKTGKVCSYREAKKRGPVAKDQTIEDLEDDASSTGATSTTADHHHHNSPHHHLHHHLHHQQQQQQHHPQQLPHQDFRHHPYPPPHAAHHYQQQPQQPQQQTMFMAPPTQQSPSSASASLSTTIQPLPSPSALSHTFSDLPSLPSPSHSISGFSDSSVNQFFSQTIGMVDNHGNHNQQQQQQQQQLQQLQQQPQQQQQQNPLFQQQQQQQQQNGHFPTTASWSTSSSSSSFSSSSSSSPLTSSFAQQQQQQQQSQQQQQQQQANITATNVPLPQSASSNNLSNMNSGGSGNNNNNNHSTSQSNNQELIESAIQQVHQLQQQLLQQHQLNQQLSSSTVSQYGSMMPHFFNNGTTTTTTPASTTTMMNNNNNSSSNSNKNLPLLNSPSMVLNNGGGITDATAAAAAAAATVHHSLSQNNIYGMMSGGNSNKKRKIDDVLSSFNFDGNANPLYDMNITPLNNNQVTTSSNSSSSGGGGNTTIVNNSNMITTNGTGGGVSSIDPRMQILNQFYQQASPQQQQQQQPQQQRINIQYPQQPSLNGATTTTTTLPHSSSSSSISSSSSQQQPQQPQQQVNTNTTTTTTVTNQQQQQSLDLVRQMTPSPTNLSGMSDLSSGGMSGIHHMDFVSSPQRTGTALLSSSSSSSSSSSTSTSSNNNMSSNTGGGGAVGGGLINNYFFNNPLVNEPYHQRQSALSPTFNYSNMMMVSNQQQQFQHQHQQMQQQMMMQQQQQQQQQQMQRTASPIQFNYRINNLTELMSNRSSMENVMRTYFDVFSMGTPLISTRESLEIATQLTSLQNFGQVTESLGRKSITLLFLTIQTFCLQRLGHKEIARQLYNQCLQLLAQQMLAPSSTIRDEKGRALESERDREGNLACALITLAFYLVGEGGDNRAQAKLFLHNCRFYVNGLMEKSDGSSVGSGGGSNNNSITDRNSDSGGGGGDVTGEVSGSNGNTCNVSRLCAIHKYMNLIELVLNEDDLNGSIEVVKKFVMFFDRMCGRDVDNSKLFSLLPAAPTNPMVNDEQTVDYLSKTSTVLDAVLTKKQYCSPRMHNIIKLTFKLMLDGLRLQFLMIDPVKNQLEMDKLADEITELVDENSEAFASCPTLVVHAVSLAGKVHMRDLEMQQPSDQISDKVQRDLNALRLLEQQFNIVSVEHGDQMREMEQWMQKKRNKFSASSSPSHRLGGSTQQNAALFEDFLKNIDSVDPALLDSAGVETEAVYMAPPSPEDSDRLFEMLIANDATME